MTMDAFTTEAGRLALRRSAMDRAGWKGRFQQAGNKLSRSLLPIRRYAKKLGRGLKPFRQNNWLVLLIIALFGLTQLALLWRPVVGIYGDAVTLAVLTGLALWRAQLRQLATATAILPVASLVTLSLPQTTIFAETVVYYSVILVLGLIYRYLFTMDYPLRETHLSLRDYAFAVPVMLVIGQLLGTLGYLLLRHHYTFGHTSLPLVAATAVVFAIAEETLFRGLIQQTASQIMHPLVAGLLVSMLYVLASIGTATALAPLVALIMGPVLAFVYYKKNNVVLTIAINAMSKLAYIGLLASFVFR